MMIDRLSINQYTLIQLSLPQFVQGCAEVQIHFVGLWRDKVAETGIKETVALLNQSGIRLSSLCRGGFFPAKTALRRQQNLEDNYRAVDEAVELGADLLVLVCGGIANGDIEESRKSVLDGIGTLLPYAQRAGIKLGIEPLHPMFVADRSVIVTLRQANEIMAALPSPNLGVVIDVYHVWWDPEIRTEIERAAGRIFGFHVNDWIVPPPDILNGRGMMGDGVIELRKLRQMVEKAGYRGPIEVEIFNERLWQMQPADLLRLTKERFLTNV
jgi:sugar phosphate isomerase/epimerase